MELDTVSHDDLLKDLNPTVAEPTDNPADVSADSGTATDAPNASDPGADTEEQKRSKGIQKRIDEIVKQREDARRETEYWREQALKSQQKPPESDPKQADAKTDKPAVETFETYDAYLEAMAEWKAERALEAREQKRIEQQRTVETETAQARQMAEIRAKYEAAAEKYPEVKAAISGNENFPLSQTMVQAIFDSDKHAEILQYLANNEQEAKRLFALPLATVSREVGRLESKLEATKPQPKLPGAPPPIEPIAGGGGEPAGDINSISDDDQWLAAERERCRKLGRLY